MPSLDAPPPLQAVANGTVNGNGVNGHSPDRPETPAGSMALTEYSMNFSTPSAEKRENIKKIVPEEYLMPNGYPDVRSLPHMSSGLALTDILPPSTCE